jgi:hypothetical protein
LSLYCSICDEQGWLSLYCSICDVTLGE